MIGHEMPAFIRKYSDEQRDAIAYAYTDRKIRPASRVVQLAAAGELEWKGEKLEPFQTNENYVRDLGRDLKRKRAGHKTGQLAELPPRDAIEALRRRLVNAADTLLADYETRMTKNAYGCDPERLRQITRAVKEAASLPGPGDPRPKPPGSKQGGTREGGETKGGIAGQILKDARNETGGKPIEPAQKTSHPQNAYTENTTNGTTADRSQNQDTAETERDSGSLAQELAARFSTELEELGQEAEISGMSSHSRSHLAP